MSGQPDETEFFRGDHFVVLFAREQSGRLPVLEAFSVEHHARHAKSLKKIQSTIARFACTRPGGFQDPLRFKPIGDGLYEFRDDQVRLLAAFDGKARLLLLEVVFKKKDDLKPEDVARADRVLSEHREWRRMS